MLFVIKVVLPNSHCEVGSYPYIAYCGDTLDSKYLHRVDNAQDVLDFFEIVRSTQHNFIHVRGFFQGTCSEWDELIAPMGSEVSASCRWGSLNQDFCLELPIQDCNALANLKLMEFGDYAFGLTAHSIHIACQNWDPRAPVCQPPAVELVELPWDGAFEAHGVFFFPDVSEELPSGLIGASVS